MIENDQTGSRDRILIDRLVTFIAIKTPESLYQSALQLRSAKMAVCFFLHL